MKQILILTILGLFSFRSYSQSLSPEVFSSGGNVQNYNQWTIGEPIILTLIGNNNILTEGFNQGTLDVTQIEIAKNDEDQINVYPNPVSTFLNINITSSTNHKWTAIIVDLSGRIVYEKNNIDNQTQIDFSNFISSAFILKLNNTHNFATYKIIKK